MHRKLAIYLIDTAKEVLRENKRDLTSENISEEFNKLVELMGVPRENVYEYTEEIEYIKDKATGPQ